MDYSVKLKILMLVPRQRSYIERSSSSCRVVEVAVKNVVEVTEVAEAGVKVMEVNDLNSRAVSNKRVPRTVSREVLMVLMVT